MPFSTTNTLLTDPEVRVVFDGLLILSPQVISGVDACVVTTPNSSDHVLTVQVFEYRKDQPYVPVVHLVGPTKTLELKTDKVRGVKAFRPDDLTHPNHFRSALEIRRIHPMALKNTTNFGITVTDGVLYSSLLSSRPISSANHDNPANCGPYPFPLAVLLGADIKLDGAKFLPMFDGDLLFEPDPTKQYLIYLSNTRIAPQPSANAKSDWEHYYHALKNVASKDKVDLYFKPCPVTTKDTTRVPCMSAVFDGS